MRIRKNADENYVLGKVIKRLSQVVSTLNVKEFREPMSVANNFIRRLPFEYYMDELFLSRVGKDNQKKPKNDLEIEDSTPNKILNIQDVLRCNDALASFAEGHKDKLDNSRVSSCPKNLDKPGEKYPYPKISVRNALLSGSRCDLGDLHCTARLHSQ